MHRAFDAAPLSAGKASGGILLASLSSAIASSVLSLRVCTGARCVGDEARFIGVLARFEGLEPRFAEVDSRFVGVKPRVAEVELRFAGVEPRFVVVELRVADVESRFGRDIREGAKRYQ